MVKPYIGVTDVASGEQAKLFLDKFVDYGGAQRGFRLMVGIMMSRKTLHGLPTKWADVWPKKEDIASIFIKHPAAMNALHYADYDSGTDPVFEDIERAVSFGGPNLHALQLDMPWPNPRDVITVKRKYPWLEIVLQVSQKAYEQCEDDLYQVAQKLQRYTFMDGCRRTWAIDHVLLDCSGGKGQPMNGARLCQDIDLLQMITRVESENEWEILPALRGYAVAGGLGPDTLDLLNPVLNLDLSISIDAQGRLRPSHDAKVPLDEVLVLLYLERAILKLSGLEAGVPEKPREPLMVEVPTVPSRIQPKCPDCGGSGQVMYPSIGVSDCQTCS